MKGNKRSALAGLLAGLLVGGSGVAVAAVAAEENAIKACVGADGVVRIPTQATSSQQPDKSLPPPSRLCPPGETELTWNKTGPQGATGPAGPQGEQGVPGMGGPAHMWYRVNGFELDRHVPTNVFRIELEAGSYRADASIGIGPSNSTGAGKNYLANCTIHGGGRGYMTNTSSDSHRVFLDLSTVFTLESKGTVEVKCVGSGTGSDFTVKTGYSTLIVQRVSETTTTHL